MRRDFYPDQLPPKGCYHLLTAIVVPRPIAWVSTVSTDGIDNLAPHSFFSVSCAEPPIIQFTSVGMKDSLRNVLATGEFVVCFAPESLYEAINETATDYPPEISEFDMVGVTREPSLRVRPPRVLESPAAIECTLNRTIELGDSTVVMGDVVHIAIDEDVLDLSRPDRPHPRIEALRPLSRLGKDEWGLLGEIRSIARNKYGA